MKRKMMQLFKVPDFKQLLLWLVFVSFALTPCIITASNNNFRVLEISERTYNSGPAIAVLFSEPLDPTVRHDEFLRISDPRELLKSAWVLSDDKRILYFPHVEPETEYSVSVLEDLKSAEGDYLVNRISQSVITRKITPIISFASEGLLLPSKMTNGLPVVTVNIPKVEMDFFRLNEKAWVNFVNWQNVTGRKDTYEIIRIKEEKLGSPVFSGRFDLNPPANKRTICHIPVENIEALQEPGIYMAVMREPGEYNYDYQTTYFMVSDIGLHVRIYKNESLIVASSLRTGEPLYDVKLTFYNNEGKSVGEGTSNKDGCYTYPENISGKVNVIKASYENNVTLLSLNTPALDMSEFDPGKRGYQPREIFLYSPRDLYRPGEKMFVSALLRDYDGRITEPLPLTAKLYQGDGKEIRNFTWHIKALKPAEDSKSKSLFRKSKPDEFNYYQTELNLPNDAQTGLWSLKVWDNPSGNPVGIFEFHVEEFLPERMKLDLTSEDKYPDSNANLAVNLLGEYLYGAPASGNNLEAKVRVKAKRDIFDSFKGFQFGDIKDKDYKDYWELPAIALNNEGKALLNIQNRWNEIKSPLSVLVVCSLFESGGRPVVRGLDQIVFPGKSMIGIRPLFNEESADEGPLKFEVVKVTPEGKMLPVTNLMVDIAKEDRDYYWEYSGSTGWKYNYTEKNYQFLTDTLNIEADKPASYTLQLQNGQYVFAVKDPETNLITSIRFRVGYWWYDREQEGGARPDKVVLKTDKPAYRPGDVIQLTVTPPHEGDAVIMVEGENPLWFNRTKVSPNGTVVEIPVSAKWNSHNLYISAVVFRPGNAKEKITPNRAVGLLHLPLDRSARKLNIAIEAPEKAASQGPVTVKLKLSNPENTESESVLDQVLNILDKPKSHDVFVTLAAVDVGILNITDFKAPDPFKWLFEPRRFDVNSYDIYGKVIENLDGQIAALRFGGDADLAAGKRPESKVKLLTLFQSPVIFDEKGEASVKFDLPDFNGRIRLMAVAFDKDRFGSAETDVTVAAPIVTQLSTPRFLAPGDTTELTLDVHNLSGKNQELKLNMSATEPLILENGEQTINLNDGEKKTLRFPVKAAQSSALSSEGYQSGTIRLNLKGDNVALESDWQLGVRPGYPAIARKVRKILNSGSREQIKFSLDTTLAADMIPATVDAGLKISPLIPLDIRNAMQGLISYPYGCLEQTTSTAYPLLFATPERIAQYNLPPISHEERIKRLDFAVQRISSMQLASGGFGLWSKDSPEVTWLTVYVADFLVQARDLSVNVPEQMLYDALNRLEAYLQSSVFSDEYAGNSNRAELDFAIRSYASYVLAKLGRASLGTLRTLYDNHHKEAGSCLPLAHLGIALQKMGDDRRAQEAFEFALSKRREQYGYWGDYGSLLRDLALTISLFIESGDRSQESGVRSQKAESGFEQLMLDLETELHNRQWLSTQEKCAIFRAGFAMEDGLAGKEWKGKLNIAGKEKVLKQRGSFFARLSGEDISKGVSFISETPGFLYASAVVGGYTKTPPPKEDAQIVILRELFDSEGKAVAGNEFKVGELLVAHIRINSLNGWLPDALIADLLPAGFELENPNLKHSFKLDDLQIDGKNLWRLKEETNIVHEEYRDDRYVAVVQLAKNYPTHLFYLIRAVSPGTFSVPPPFAESMYRPEIRGIGDTPASVTVVNKSQ